MITILLYLALILVPLIFLLMAKIKKMYSFFNNKCIKYIKPTEVAGDWLLMLQGKKSQIEILDSLCEKFPDEPMIGYYNFTAPFLLIQNAEYVEKILIKDFTHFTDHGMNKMMEKTQSIYDESLFMMDGKRWRAFRYKLSPLFTTGKLRVMFSSMGECRTALVQHLKTKDAKNIDLKEAAGLFSLDVFGSSIFGLEAKVLENPECEYHKYGKKAFDMSLLDFVKLLLLMTMPGFIVRLLKLQFNKPDVVKYFSGIVKDTLKYRRENKVQRNDLVQLLLQLGEKQKIELQTWDPNDEYLKPEEVNEAVETFEVTDEILTVQAFSFLVAGYDSLALTIMFTCYELTQNPEIQEKLREEVMEQVKAHSGLNFDALRNMTNLENAIKETLRLHPVAPILQRSCTKDYTFPNGYTIRKGEPLQVSIKSIHRNPNYYEDPDTFRPERFENPITPGTFLSFGDGPRICIAMRYALLHVKIGVATLLMNYKMKLSPKVELPFKLKTVSFFKQPKDTLIFELEPISCPN